MNSGLQCLSHIEPLTKYFITKEYLKDINVDNPLGTHGELSTEYAKMIKNLWLGTETTFSPNHLKKSIGKFQPMFSGYNQHDSGELITYLLDGLHEDLNRVK
jgi:ubiquitin carboxyl-terminal hydrolase 4/11/15